MLHSFSYYSGDLYFKKLFLLAYCYSYEIVRCICSEVFLMQVLIDSIYSRTWFYWMISVRTRMDFYTFGTHKFQAYSLCAEVCDRFSSMIQAGYKISEICFHVFDAESFVHNTVIILYCLKFINFCIMISCNYLAKDFINWTINIIIFSSWTLRPLFVCKIDGLYALLLQFLHSFSSSLTLATSISTSYSSLSSIYHPFISDSSSIQTRFSQIWTLSYLGVFFSTFLLIYFFSYAFTIWL